MERTKYITLTANGVSKSFDIDHAERILGMPHNGGWKILEENKYIFENGIIVRRNKRVVEEATKG